MRSELSRQICRGCKRNLPRAASRCPWCQLPVPPGDFRRVKQVPLRS